MSRRLKDLIRTFEPAAKPAEPAAAQPEAAPAAAAFVDGPTAAAMVDFTDAVIAVAALLEEETEAVEAGDPWKLDIFAVRKLAVADRLEAVTAELKEIRPNIAGNPDLRAMALQAIERLDRAVAANTSALSAMREAVLSVNRTLLSAVEKAASEGLYAPSGQAVRPVELSTAGVDAEL
jgi:hypothetical protein